MDFNFRLLAKQLKSSLTQTGSSLARLTPKRIAFLIFFFPIFGIMRLSSTLGFMMDDIFYKEYQDQPVAQPVFIIGNMRSGTTLMHRLLARDLHNFSFMRMWEIIFAPSITQRKFVWAIAKMDEVLFKGNLKKALLDYEKKTDLNNPIHKISLVEAEEDEHLLINIWESLATSVLFPAPELVRKYARFDQEVSRRDRRRIMRFYRQCLRKHLFSYNSGKKFLSKNPTFSPKVDSLLEFFPDAKIVYMVRNPLATIPSLVSLMKFQWGQVADPQGGDFEQDYLMEMAQEWYRYPLERLAQAPENSYEIVVYDEVTRDPKGVVTRMYEKFGFELTEDFADILEEANQKARTYKSKHSYQLADLGLTRERIVQQYDFIFKRFGFDTNSEGK